MSKVIDDGGITRIEIRKSTLIELGKLRKPGQTNNELVLELIAMYNLINGEQGIQ